VAGRVVVVGAVNRDLVVTVPRLPARGETVGGAGIATLWGGKAANVASAAARLGAEAVLVCAVGDDAEGTAAVSALERAGVRVLAERVAEPTGTAVVLVDAAGDNCIAVRAGANGVLSAGYVAAALAGLAPVGVLVLSTEVPLAPLRAAAGEAAGATVLLSPSPLPAGGVDLPAGIVVVNEHEAALLGPYPAGAALVTTLGAGGARLAAADGTRLTVPGLTVSTVDTTGAGDAFLGAFAAEIALDVPLARALETAVRAGAYAVTGEGARHHATRADLTRLGA
jgi:ribokinase